MRDVRALAVSSSLMNLLGDQHFRKCQLPYHCVNGFSSGTRYKVDFSEKRFTIKYGDKINQGSAQDQESGIAHPIFTPVLAPEITSTSHAALVKWRKKRTVYEDIMRARCQTSGEDFDAVTRSVKDSFDRKLLETWCRLRWQIAVDDVDDDRLRTEIDGIINSVNNHFTRRASLVQERFSSQLEVE
ncbi:hypothetical protein F441_01422 [Phytophthora nicotianae CJ01A1]|uniref:Uncharacterized protein n=1 Tax=Phytophthora nicotianae CJ01A1 TaxID=1317063 RepID=W2XTM4_PHYNI|nr:hypothetical protein F441_01422 [Phytophthora nicotianae CJ01A1]